MLCGKEPIFYIVNNVMKLYLDLHFCDRSLEQEIRRHCSIFATLDYVKPSPLRQKRTTWNYSNADFNGLRNTFKDMGWIILKNNDIDIYINNVL